MTLSILDDNFAALATLPGPLTLKPVRDDLLKRGLAERHPTMLEADGASTFRTTPLGLQVIAERERKAAAKPAAPAPATN